MKPTVAATAYRTARVSLDAAATDQQKLERVLAHSDALVQPFVPEIQTEGEWSLIYLGGKFSHSVKKYPEQSDYRVQAEFGDALCPNLLPGHSSTSVVEHWSCSIEFHSMRVSTASRPRPDSG